MKEKFDLICLVSNDLNTDRRMIRTCETLSKGGWRVLLIGRSKKESSPLKSELFEQHRIKCIFNSGPVFYLELIVRFSTLLKNYNYNNLLCVDLDTALTIRLIKKGSQKYFLDLHEYFEKVPELIGKRIRQKIWKVIGGNVIPKFDVVYTVNQSLSDIFSKKYKRKVEFVRNVPRISIRRQAAFSNPLVCVYLGVLNPGRGLENLIEVVKERKDVQLRIIGDGPLRNQLEKISNDSRQITFEGSVSPDQISDKLKGVHLGWNLLSKNSPSYYYSLANKFFDYTNYGIPVVTMDFPEYRKIIRNYNCGFLLKDNDKTTIHSVINQVVSDPGKWKQMHESCFDVGSEYNWSIESQKLRSILGQSKRPV